MLTIHSVSNAVKQIHVRLRRTLGGRIFYFLFLCPKAGLPRGVRQQRSYEMPTVLGDVANAANLTDEGTIVEPTGINIAPPAEAPQPEAPGEPAFDTTG